MTYILDKKVHARLIQDMDHVCFTAGVPRRYVENSMVGVAQERDIDWFKNFRAYKQEFSGLVLVGGTDIESRMQALCGALLRNFIDARIMSLRTIVPIKDGEGTQALEPSVLLVPNLHTKTHGGKPLTAWQVQTLYDTLLTRMSAGKQTVMFVEDMEQLGQDYGVLFKEHLLNHYKRIEG